MYCIEDAMNLLMDWSHHCYRTDVDFDSLNVILIHVHSSVEVFKDNSF